MTDTLSAALSLAARGLRVFPLKANGKKPIFARFQLSATSDPVEIARVWALPDCEGCNVGVLTTDMIVADLDVKDGRNGVESYKHVDGNTYDTFVVRTPNDGFHCYFDGPDSGLAVNVFDGIDIRSHNGYVVGPGSTIDGLAYEIAVDLPIAWVPAGIANVVKAPRSASLASGSVEKVSSTAAIANAAVWLATQAPAIEGQGGDDHTYRMAARLVREYALSTEAAFEAMGEWNARCSPPWEAGELWLKITNASEYGIGDLGAAQPTVSFGAVKILEVPAPPPAPAPVQLGVYMGNLPAANTITARPWRVHNFLMTGDVTVLAGVGAAGKSIVQLSAAAHFSVGKDFGPWKLAVPGHPLRTVIYNAEDDLPEQARRMFAICVQFGFDYDEVKKNIAFVGVEHRELNIAKLEGGRTPVQDSEGVDFITQTIADCQADIAMFDPLLNIHTCDENDNPQMRFVITLLKSIARACNASVLVAHHSGKSAGAKDKGDADAVRGASAIVNSSRIALLLSSITKEDANDLGVRDRFKYIRLDNAKMNYGARSEKALAYFEWGNVSTPYGDQIGVPTPSDLTAGTLVQRMRNATIIINGMIEAGTATTTKRNAGTIMAGVDELWGKASASTRSNWIEKLLHTAIETPSGTLSIVAGEVALTG